MSGASERHASQHGTDIDNGAGAARAHRGQYRLDRSDRAEVVRLEHPLREIKRHVFDRPTARDSGVVHEDIDDTRGFQHPLYRMTDRMIVIHVKDDRGDGQRLSPSQLQKFRAGFDRTQTRVDVEALTSEMQGRSLAYSGTCSCYKRDRHVCLLSR